MSYLPSSSANASTLDQHLNQENTHQELEADEKA